MNEDLRVELSARASNLHLFDFPFKCLLANAAPRTAPDPRPPTDRPTDRPPQLCPPSPLRISQEEEEEEEEEGVVPKERAAHTMYCTCTYLRATPRPPRPVFSL